MFAYCLNNPLNQADDGGALANWIIGGIVGGLIGGISAAIQGEDILAGAAQGAVTGMIAGASIDIALAVVATGGVAGVVVAAGIAFVGGAGASIAGEEVNAIITTGEVKPIDTDMIKRAEFVGLINAVTLGFSTLQTAAYDGINELNTSRKLVDIAKTAVKNLKDLSVSDKDVLSVFGAVHFAIHGEMADFMIAKE